MDLEIGKAYFEISWSTNETQVPDIESYIYIGKNIFGGESEEHFSKHHILLKNTETLLN